MFIGEVLPHARRAAVSDPAEDVNLSVIERSIKGHYGIRSHNLDAS